MSSPFESPAIAVETLSEEQARQRLPDLVALVRDVVAGGASVGFMPPFPPDEARAWWESILPEISAGRRMLLVALAGGRVAGSAQLELAMKPNARHRAEVQKVLVLSAARRHGIASLLMRAVEREAQARGRTLLYLDTESGSGAHALYLGLGYVEAGSIPDYAYTARGDLTPTTILYKRLAAG